MAIAFARINYLSRAKGHSAVAASAYRSGTKLYDERCGKLEDYTNHSDHVVHSKIMLPADASGKFLDREYFWNAVEAAEDKYNPKHRKRAQVAVDCILALPKDEELSRADLIELAERFAYDHFVAKGVPVDINIHDKDDGNPHAHILRTTRRLIGDDFDPLKARDIDPEVRKGRVQADQLEWERWRNYQNNFFKEKGIDLEVDPNGIISQVHLGKHTFHHPEREYSALWQENEERKQEAYRIAQDDPNILLQELTLNKAIFTRAQLAKLLDKRLSKLYGSVDANTYQRALAEVEGSPYLLALGKGVDGQEYFTTQAMFEAENDIQLFADHLKSQHRHQVSEKIITACLSETTLSDEQQAAVRHLLDSRSISALLGRSGTGKSYALGAARDAWVEAGFKVHGLALSGKAADNLSKSSGIESRTIESFRYALSNGYLKLTAKDVVVLDEAGMADSLQFRDILLAVAKANAKFVYVGDPDQTRPVGPGASMRALLERTGYAELSEIRRQKVSWMRQATEYFADSQIAMGLNLYNTQVIAEKHQQQPKADTLRLGQVVFYETEQEVRFTYKTENEVIDGALKDTKIVGEIKALGKTEPVLGIEAHERMLRSIGYHKQMQGTGSFIHFAEDKEATMARLINDWLEASTRRGYEQCAIMAYANNDVAALNKLARAALIEQGKLNQGLLGETTRGDKRFAVGERIQFLKNDHKRGVSNGEFGTVAAVVRDRKDRLEALEVRIDGHQETTMIALKDFQHIDYGYAATVNKYQGETADESFTFASGFGWNRHLTYTALGRHRHSARLYASQDEFKSQAELFRTLGKEAPLDSLYDWPWLFRERRGMPTDDASVLSRFRRHLTKKLADQVIQLRDEFQERYFSDRYWRNKQALVAKRQVEHESDVKKQQYEDAATVYEYTEAARLAGKTWAKVFEAKEKNTERFKEEYDISEHSEYQTVLEATTKRDELAHTIYSDLDRYEKALSFYQLDLDKIEKQARIHVGREVVEDYLAALKNEQVSLRDRLAHQITQEPKTHAPAVSAYEKEIQAILASQAKEWETKDNTPPKVWSILYEHARAYQKQQLIDKLDDTEQEALHRVEAYLKAYQEAAKLWQEFFDSLKDSKYGDSDILEFAKSASMVRNQLAGVIYDKLEQHREGLNFYNIDKEFDTEGAYLPFRYNKKQGEFNFSALKANRAVKLKKYAHQEFGKQRLEQYLAEEDQEKRSVLADQIVHYPKQHALAIDRYINKPVKEEKIEDPEARAKFKKDSYFALKDKIKQDAFYIRQKRLAEKLDQDGKDALALVAYYHEVTREVKAAWQCFYANGKQENDANKANLLAVTRDELAAEFHAKPERYYQALTLFEVKTEDLAKSLQSNACRKRVSFYLDPNITRANKLELAAFMVEHRAAHTAALSLAKIDWRTVYPYADKQRHDDLRQTLKGSALAEFNLLSEYARLRRRLASVIANKKQHNKEWTVEQQHKFDKLQSRRDELAYQLLRREFIDQELWSAFRLSPHKCAKHAGKHAVLTTQLRSYQDERTRLLKELRKLANNDKALARLIDEPTNEFKQFQQQWVALSSAAQKFLYRQSKLSAAIAPLAINLETLEHDKNLLAELAKLRQLKGIEQDQELLDETPTTSFELLKPVEIGRAKKRWDLEFIKARLNERAHDVALAAVHPSEVFNAKKSNQSKLIWGQKGGSLQVTIAGERVGCWNDFSDTSSGGHDLLSFIERQQGLSKKDAINWAVSFLGLGESAMTINEAPKLLSVSEQQKISDQSFTKEQWKRIIEAREYWQSSQPITGTLAERYLREHRAIAGPISDTFRYHPKVLNYGDMRYHPALLIGARNNKDEIQLVQATFLDPVSAKKIDKDLRQKQTLGPTPGVSVWLNGHKEGRPVAAVEGAETAQSVLEAVGDRWSVVCVCGASNFKSLKLPKEVKDLILVQDHDHFTPCSISIEAGSPKKQSFSQADLDMFADNKPVCQLRYDLGEWTLSWYRNATNRRIVNIDEVDGLKALLHNKQPKSLTEQETLKITHALQTHFCRPNSEKSVLDAAYVHSQKGVNTWRVKPATVGEDYNDLHQREGIEAVKAALQKGKLCHKGLNYEAELDKLKEKLFDIPNKTTSASDWLKEARTLNKAGQTEMAIELMSRNKRVFAENDFKDAMTHCIKAHVKSNSLLNSVMIASTAEECQALNLGARMLLKQAQRITDTMQVKMGEQFSELGKGDLIRFVSAWPEKDIAENTQAQVLAVKNGRLKVKFSDQKQLTINLADYHDLDYGYALRAEQLTRSKYQQVDCYLSQSMQQKDMQKILDLSQKSKLYYSRENFADLAEFKAKTCQREQPSQPKESVNKPIKQEFSKRKYGKLPTPMDD